jgi:hypothetical protein
MSGFPFVVIGGSFSSLAHRSTTQSWLCTCLKKADGNQSSWLIDLNGVNDRKPSHFHQWKEDFSSKF